MHRKIFFKQFCCAKLQRTVNRLCLSYYVPPSAALWNPGLFVYSNFLGELISDIYKNRKSRHSDYRLILGNLISVICRKNVESVTNFRLCALRSLVLFRFFLCRRRRRSALLFRARRLFTVICNKCAEIHIQHDDDRRTDNSRTCKNIF